MSASHVRKPVYDLAVADLEQRYAWEFALDQEGEEGQDEVKGRPSTAHGPLDPSEGMFLVRTRLSLADGTQLKGYLTPPIQRDASVGMLRPAVVPVTVGFRSGVACSIPSKDTSQRIARASGSRRRPEYSHCVSESSLLEGFSAGGTLSLNPGPADG